VKNVFTVSFQNLRSGGDEKGSGEKRPKLTQISGRTPRYLKAAKSRPHHD
jgi:hypothetical protein